MKKQLIVMYKENKDDPKNSWSGTSYNLKEALKNYYDVIFIDTNDTLYLRIIKKLSRKLGSIGASNILKPYYESLHKKQMEDRIKNYPGVPVLEIAENVELDNNDFYLYRDMTYACFPYVKERCDGINHKFIHGMLRSISESELKNRIKNEEILETKAKASFYMGQWLAREMAEIYPERKDKFIAVGGGLNNEFEEVEMNRRDNQILFVGVDFLRKGGDLVVEAFKRMNEKYDSDYKLIVAGVNQQEGYTGDNIEYLGKTSRKDLSKLFKESTIFCMPSRFEAYGLVFLEAKSYGLPIVAMDQYEMSYFVEDGKNGYLIQNENIDVLADALYKALNNQEMRDYCGENKDYFKSQYTWDNVACKIFENISSC